MATLRDIKTRISSVESTKKITKAMKMVSSAKLRRAQDRLNRTRPYANKIKEFIDQLLPKVDVLNQPLILQREIRKTCVIVVSADRGLCGGFNHNVLRYALEKISEYEKESAVTVYPVGKKAFEVFRKMGYDIYDNEIQLFNQLNYEHALNISGKVVKAYLDNSFDRVVVIYNQFVSALRQELVMEQYLPLAMPEGAEEGVVRGSLVEAIYEPDKETLLSSLIPKSLEIHMWRVLSESNAAEEAARKMAMESATDNATELIDSLTLKYNRTRQAVITKEIAEIVGAAEALKG
jgi:F-type H+-transporting ATPase subunit gamma